MKAHNLIGVLCLNKRDFSKAINEFRIVRDIAEEAESDIIRLHAFNMLGSCYQYLREYENAIKCFKKQLEIAW
jgi:tetratricopeptide (TPR) repeat protein